jgi:hypothetical protein
LSEVARKISAVITALALVGCGAGSSSNLDPADGGTIDTGEEETGRDASASDRAPVTTPYTWWNDVEPIVRARCQQCHSMPPMFGAPRALVEYLDTQVAANNIPVHELMAYRVVAPQNRMPPASQPQLTNQQRAIIMSWSAGGAPEGERPAPVEDAGVVEADSGVVDNPDSGPAPRPISRRFEIRAHNPNSTDPFDMPMEQTNYTCFAFTIPAGTPSGESAFRFEHLIDNVSHTHHTLLFVNENADSPEDRPFGCDGLPLTWNMVAGWAPGRMAEEIPRGVGVPLEPGTQLILQVHYDRVMTAGETDQSGVDVVMTDEPNLEPAGMLWSGVIWQQALDGNNVSKTHTCTLNSDLTIFSVFPHMHKTGTQITLELQRAGTTDWVPLVDISGWNFEDQPNVAIAEENQQLRSGDKLRTKCWWNTMGRSIPFGEASDDEMCFNFIYHYPQISFQLACVGYQF